MKDSHFKTPRSLDACHFDPRGQALFREKQAGAGLFAAVVYAILGALALVHWLSN